MTSLFRKKFGFGCMRLPLLDKENPTSFDYAHIEAMFDAFIAGGYSYFDTAYTYHGYKGETAVRKALVERHPREDFQLATKLPLRDMKSNEHLPVILQEQLQNSGVDFFDAYLLHNMGRLVYPRCRDFKVFDFLAQMKDEGKIRLAGMSFHDKPELLAQILEQDGSVLDFIQLQVNYVDMEQGNVQSRRCMEVAAEFNKPVIVMEPLKGGALVNIPEEGEAILRSIHPDATPASWAFRFAAMQPGVELVLSGMGTIEQVQENMALFDNLTPLNDQELDAIAQVRDMILERTAFACTSCEYCMPDCPMNIAIPHYFALYNSAKQFPGGFASQNAYYFNLATSYGKASECIECGQCEAVCPQHLPIRDYLKLVAEKYEVENPFPVRYEPKEKE